MKSKPQHRTIDAVIAQRLRQAHVDAGVSQVALAEKIDVTFQQLQKYETGVNRISCGRLVMVCDALALPVDHFFAGLTRA